MQVAPGVSAAMIDMTNPSVAQIKAHELMNVFLTGASPHDLRTAALHQLLHLSTTSASAQVCHGHPSDPLTCRLAP